MTLSLITCVILGLSIGLAATSFIAVASFREVLRAHRTHSDQYSQFLGLLAKMEANHSEQTRNFQVIADLCRMTAKETGGIISDLLKYFESNALTKKIIPLNEEGNPV